jgi:hypothetical protein
MKTRFLHIFCGVALYLGLLVGSVHAQPAPAPDPTAEAAKQAVDEIRKRDKEVNELNVKRLTELKGLVESFPRCAAHQEQLALIKAIGDVLGKDLLPHREKGAVIFPPVKRAPIDISKPAPGEAPALTPSLTDQTPPKEEKPTGAQLLVKKRKRQKQ